ncbi:hypothetical protein ACQUSR_00420 [Streptomyces sp. P1-3]|uniref:hypothetical protein n=1 Tax=Streptomyces sp. P1-3 TaxID=3421658 RepID=UPI003D36EF01
MAAHRGSAVILIRLDEYALRPTHVRVPTSWERVSWAARGTCTPVRGTSSSYSQSRSAGWAGVAGQ